MKEEQTKPTKSDFFEAASADGFDAHMPESLSSPETAAKQSKRHHKAKGAPASCGHAHSSGASHKTGTHKSGGKKRTVSSTRAEQGGKGAASHHRRKKRKKADRNMLFLHLGFLALVLLIFIVGIVKLVNWNRGRVSEYDPNEDTTEFDIETEDFFVPMSSSTAALQKDDGVTSILLLGNGTLARNKKDADSIGNQLAELTGGAVYDGSINHSFLSVKNVVYEEDYPTDVFSLYWVSHCIASGDFTLLEDNARIWEGDELIQETVEMLKNLDMSAIDVITIMYDYHDYESGRLLAGPYDDTLAASCCGCLLQSIRLLQQAYPHIRIIVASPGFNYIEDDNGIMQPGSTYDLGQGTLADYMIAYKNIAVNSNVSFIDNYFGTITVDNYQDYLEEGLERVNSAGRTALAKRMASFIGTAQPAPQ